MSVVKKKYFELSNQRVISIILLIFFFSIPLNAQQKSNIEIKNLGTNNKKNVIYKITKLLNDNYIFPDTAKKMEKFLYSKLKSKDYSKINDPMEYSEILTKDLQSISKDKHIRVVFDPQAAKELQKRKSHIDDSAEIIFQNLMRDGNYGFKKIEILNGNIGYLDFRNFAPSKYSKKTVASVMGFLENTNAIIIDLRQNGGGDPDGVRLICSYFFDTTPVHLNDLYYRPENKTEEYWTLADIDGKHMPNIDLYILTSKFTFSGAEEFSYNLKNLRRATIIGDTTGGGAHPGDLMGIDENFIIFVPTGRAINPITKTNWEGTGVIPDVPISSDKALETAQIMALEKISKTKFDTLAKKNIAWQIELLKSVVNPFTIDASMLKTYAGIYTERTVSYDDGKLYYERAGRQKFQMVPMSEDTFGFKELEFFRIKFVKDTQGKISSLTGMYSDGRTDSSPKTN